jgi:hypothetical protein
MSATTLVGASLSRNYASTRFGRISVGFSSTTICPTTLLAADYMHNGISELDNVVYYLFTICSLRTVTPLKSALANLATQLAYGMSGQKEKHNA